MDGPTRCATRSHAGKESAPQRPRGGGSSGAGPGTATLPAPRTTSARTSSTRLVARHGWPALPAGGKLAGGWPGNCCRGPSLSTRLARPRQALRSAATRGLRPGLGPGGRSPLPPALRGASEQRKDCSLVLFGHRRPRIHLLD
eukprot:14845652-Alexandrium_andersonii.AAC.1